MSTSMYASTSVKIQAAWAPLVQQILTTVNADTVNQAQSTAPAMNSTIDSLINQLSSLSAANTNKLAALAKAGILEAQVVSSKPFTSNSLVSPQTIANQQAQFIVSIKVNNQLLELISSQALAAGTRLQLVVKPNNTVMIVNITEPSNTTSTSASLDKTNIALPLRQSLAKQSNTINHAPTNTVKPSPHSTSAEAKSTTNSGPNPHTIIEQNLRQSLPLQQPVEKLLPLLQQLNKQSPPQWPRSLINNLDVLLKQFPSAKQLHQPAGVKQAINNSGMFFEAKLAALLANANSNRPATQSGTSAINYDIKGLLQRIIGQINKNNTELAKTTLPRASSTNRSDSNQVQGLAYTPQPLSELLPNLHKTAASKAENSDKNADILLRQLSNQLIASLARSQTNQLETLLHRRTSSTDQQAPSNSWSVETPIVQGNHIDNLSIRIDQQAKDENNARDKSDQTKQWTVMLAFDLHQLGKMNVQLKIIDQTVSATVWTEQQPTHQQAQQEVQQLKKNLQKVGVNVKKIDCQLGLPANNTQPLYNKLVDVRT